VKDCEGQKKIYFCFSFCFGAQSLALKQSHHFHSSDHSAPVTMETVCIRALVTMGIIIVAYGIMANK
jgi:hypothetical protein